MIKKEIKTLKMSGEIFFFFQAVMGVLRDAVCGCEVED